MSFRIAFQLTTTAFPAYSYCLSRLQPLPFGAARQ